MQRTVQEEGFTVALGTLENSVDVTMVYCTYPPQSNVTASQNRRTFDVRNEKWLLHVLVRYGS